MNLNLERRNTIRKKRSMRVRKKVRGNGSRPRLSVFKSLSHLSVQIIDDEKGVTLASYSTLGKKGNQRTKETARLVGEKIAEIAKEKNIESIIFDRGRFKYHGIIAELANAARENGIKF